MLIFLSTVEEVFSSVGVGLEIRGKTGLRSFVLSVFSTYATFSGTFYGPFDSSLGSSDYLFS